jgi:hypothetical protein
MRLSRAELIKMGQAEFRVIADSPDEVRKLLVFLQSQFPHSIISPIKTNDSRPGYRGYLTVFKVEEKLPA